MGVAYGAVGVAGEPGIRHAMRRHSDLLRGPVAADTELARLLEGWIAKGGVEGLLCAASSDGLGVALKVVDGSFRALAPAVVHVLGRLASDASGVGGDVLTNSRDEVVGALRVVDC